ncbi:hypothetical protein PIB30_075398 [Stylosanthes scabra]|uniref:Uncharacterized protein n=1 Tax=Stylosanthes scabra TaxID=79078 RepID=A0ABU6YNV7_9FABA|nr:hypothetical protein [Stylosanthes scabra]
MISSLCVAFQDISDELDLKIKKNLIGEIASFEGAEDELILKHAVAFVRPVSVAYQVVDGF